MDYFNTLPVSKLPVKENETNNEVIKRARQTLVDEYASLLESQKITPLSLWYINNLDQVSFFEKQMRKRFILSLSHSTYGVIFMSYLEHKIINF